MGRTQIPAQDLTEEQLRAWVESAECGFEIRPWASIEPRPPGRYEGCDNPALADRLDRLDTSWYDDELSEEDGEWAARIGRVLVSRDEQGFFDYTVIRTEERAVQIWSRLRGMSSGQEIGRWENDA